MRHRARLGALAVGLVALTLPACAPRRAVPPLPARVAVAAPASPWPRRAVLDLALRAYQCGATRGYFARPMLTVIDYSLPSTEKRLWVIDLRRRRVLFHELVAHGVNSGDTWAVAFSNVNGSRQSSLGLFRTDESYIGQHGYALRLSGLEPGVNDLARERAIVIHGATYVSPRTISEHGSLGRSWGCPALDYAVSPQVIDHIRDGSAVFAYYPDRAWLERSAFLRCDARLARME